MLWTFVVLQNETACNLVLFKCMKKCCKNKNKIKKTKVKHAVHYNIILLMSICVGFVYGLKESMHSYNKKTFIENPCKWYE